MSKNREERIVEMRFENKEFESGVGQTLSTLDKLEQKLQFKGSEAGMANLESKAKSFDMSNMGNAAESVTNKFSALEVAGLAAIASIAKAATDAAINIGKNLINKYIIKPISDGFEEYELIQNTIQTIYTNTKNKGTTIEEIEEGLDDLNTYADQTIYVMSDMTKAIGQFTNAGVNFADSKKAVIGFANLAAAVGATNEQLARVEYQSSQAMSAGVFRLMDWNSIQNSPLGGEYFQKALIKNAKEYYAGLSDAARDSLGLDKNSVKTILEGLDDMENGLISFRQSFSKQKGDSFYSDWLRSDIFTETLKQFAEDPELYEAATSVRTFTKMRETLEEAAGSGWAQTWKLIVGDFGESKALWTDVSKTLSLIIDGIGDARNEVISFWKEMGGRDDVIQALKNSMEALIRILRPIKEAFDEVLSPYLKQYLLDLSSWLEEITGKMLIGEETAEGIKAVFKVIFTIAKWVLIIFDKVSKIVGTAGYIVAKVVGDVFQLIGKITHIPEKVEEAWNKIKSFLAKHGINIPTKGLEDYNEEIDKTTDKTDELKDKLTEKEDQSNFKLFGNDIFSLFGENSFLNKIETNLSKFGQWLTDIGQKIKDFFKNQNLITKEKITDFFGKILDLFQKIPGAFDKGWNKLKEFWSIIKETPEFQKLSDSLKDLGEALLILLTSVGQTGINLFNKFIDSLKDPEKKAERAEKLAEALDKISNALKKISEFVTPALTGITNLFEWLSKKISGDNSGEIEKTADAVNDLANANNNLSISENNGGRKRVSSPVDEKDLKETERTTNKWVDFYNEFAEQFGGKTLQEKEPSLLEKIFGENTKYVKSILGAGGILTAIALIINRYRKTTKLIKNTSGMFASIKSFFEEGVDIFGLKAFSKTLKAQEKAKKFRDIALGIAAVAGSIALLALTYAKLGSGAFWAATTTVAAIAGFMTFCLYALGKANLTNLNGISKDIAAFGIAILLIVGSISLLGYLADNAKDVGSYDKAIATVFGIMFGFGALCYVLSKSQSKYSTISDNFWKDFIGLAAGVYIISRAIVRLANADPESVLNAGLALTMVIGIVGVVAAALGKVHYVDKGTFRSMGSMLTSLAIAMLLATATIAVLGKMKPETLEQGAKATGAMLVIFGVILGAIARINFSKESLSAIERIGVAALIFSIAADLLLPAIFVISQLAAINFKATVAAMVGIVSIFGVMSLVLAWASTISAKSRSADDIILISTSLAIFALAASLIAGSIAKLTKTINSYGKDFWKAVGVIGGVLAIYAILAGIFAAVPEASAISVALIGFSAAIIIFAAGIYILSKAANNFAKAADKFVDALEKFANFTDSDLEKIKNNIIKFANESEDIWIAIGASLVAGAKVLEGAWDEIEPIITRILGSLIDSIETVTGTKLGPLGFSLGKSIGDMILNAFSFLITYLSENSTRIIELTEAAIAMFIQYIVEGLARVLWNINMISVGFTGWGPFTEIVETLGDFSSFINEYISNITGIDFSGAEENLSEGMDGLAGALQDPVALFNFENPVDVPILFDFTQNSDFVNNWATNLPGETAETITTQSEIDMPPAGKAIGDNAASGLDGFSSIFSGIAQNMIDSFVGTLGAQFNIDKAYSAAFSVGRDGASQGLKDGTGTNSPSKEAIYVANMMNKGLVDTLTASIPEARMTGYEYASAVVGGIKEASTDTFNTKPSITPVLRSDAVSKELSSITGVLNTSRTMSVATTAKLAARDATVMRKAAADMRAMNTYDDSKVVDNIANLGEHVDRLGTSIEGMGFYMDGKKVGRIVSPTVNRAFYTDSIRKGRNN